MGTQELMTVLFLRGFVKNTPETSASIQVLSGRGFIKQESNGHWIENREVTDKILYPDRDKPVCGHCRRQGNMGAYSPYCGHFCDSDCLVNHARRCKACGISLAMEK